MKYFDPFLMSLLGAVLLASLLPCPASWQAELKALTSLLIMLMFFFQGVKMQRHALIDSLKKWQLQGCTLFVSFTLFPLLGLGLYGLAHMLSPDGFLGAELWVGLLFLCCLPSTIQSSIALTSIARGNVPAAICAATSSNILGILLTPLLCSLIFHHGGSPGASPHVIGHHGTNGGSSGLHTVINVARELLLPFLLGQCAQPWLGPFIHQHKVLLTLTDRGSIIVLVYAAFSAAVLQGLWQHTPPGVLLGVGLADLLLLAMALGGTFILGRLMGQSIEDDITLQFCGSKKALAPGVSMASVIFPGAVGLIVLPLMIYHQLQLFLCTIIARHYAARDEQDYASLHQPDGQARSGQ